MCYMNQSICVGCSHTIYTPVRRLSARTPDLLHKICSGRNDVLCHIRHHSIEFCVFCYDNKLRAIEAQFTFKERVEVERGRLLGLGKSQLEEVRKALRGEWRREVRRLNVEWEGISDADDEDEDLMTQNQDSEEDEKALGHPGSAEPAKATAASASSSLKGDKGAGGDIMGLDSQANPGSVDPREEDLRYMHRAKPNEPPVQAPWIRQQPVSDPCTCSLPSAIDYDNHLTESEDAQLFDPASPLMNTSRARRHFLSELEIDKAMNRKRFGFVYQDGRAFLDMFPIEAKEGDVVALLRGLRHPVVVREVELGRYEWVGGCHVNTLWDWDFLEKKAEEGGAVEGLEEIVLV